MENNMIDFAIAAAKDATLGEEFTKELDKKSASGLSAWLKGKGYIVSEGDCQKMIDNAESLKGPIALIVW